MPKNKKLRVAFDIEVPGSPEPFREHGVQYVFDILFQRAKQDILRTITLSCARPTGNTTLDEEFRRHMEGELKTLEDLIERVEYTVVEE